MVLLKEHIEYGFIFYTNLVSKKVEHLLKTQRYMPVFIGGIYLNKSE